ncbi:MAG: cation-transporting P-type ATPase [Pigeon pea little leaf phytoplasma]|uniref:Cation-transporting P-type ATPase n=1 Tax=Candidatus Phytoplasma fabacearum TaxID=2982628 RepID=A0ABU8ZTM0_9MOLU|nr:cation-transporting P-type ATPase ['Bituminaria bituminosa' little leaf phytoplasma]MDV3158544.1 cation-transporting P-type ATPase [Pigeon pea little leaf phytoplasma]MDO8023767.1 cation-transporting P-type ATPase ['Bituminaria bituminosa' little leaf phytoplasma]MDV3161272.1 cation-transporting P-type ATPase [Pigeon pea little leaf phytoplasma]MDV3195599.1 cation-transporting P-type ATPase [Pigeon pea little leaf phytoplasma]MDV3200078.1 cation-transporting P-type ATPase [Pigeon pea little
MNSLFYNSEILLLVEELQTNLKTGLTEQQAQTRLSENGLNELFKTKPKSLINKFFSQLNNFFIYILLTAAFITLIIGFFSNHQEELYEGILILIIILGNAIFGAFHEHQKDKSFDIITKNTKIYVKVLRESNVKSITSDQLVPGDIVFLDKGDIVPADLRLLVSNNLQVDEAILTGESVAVAKQVEIQIIDSNLLNYKHLLFMNTVVINGNAEALVINTGMKTQIGNIAKLSQTIQKEKTILEFYLQKLTKILSIIIFILILINFIFNVMKYYLFFHYLSWDVISSYLLSSIALIVAVIPEGLLAIMTIIFAFGIKKIAKENAIVKNLKTLERLGSINVICTDKTGTLTQNKLLIKSFYVYSDFFHIDYSNKLICNNLMTSCKELVYYGLLCNSIAQHYNEKIISCYDLLDSVDRSFVELSKFLNIDLSELQQQYKLIKMFPFDDHSKLMIAIYKYQHQYLTIFKGAGEIILDLSYYIYNSQKQKNVIKDSKHKEDFELKLNQKAQMGYKVLGIAYTNFFDYRFLCDNISVKEILYILRNNIIFIGLVGIEDPIKLEVFQSIQECYEANIQTIMITGDHRCTAIQVANKLKILNKKTDLVIDGSELDKLTETELLQNLINIKVYARTIPVHKLKIVRAWQKLGYIVAMIGDGVNDVPSIKQADVGLAMGLSGTEITKQSADIVLMDDNFHTILTSIKEGQNVFVNIRKSLVFLLSCNMGEICLILFNSFFGFFYFPFDFVILNTLQILWINLVTDSLVALALGMEPPEHNIIDHSMMKKNNNFLNKSTIYKIFLEGLMLGIIVFGSAILGYYSHSIDNFKYGQTFAFMVLAFSQLFHAWNFRSLSKSIFSIKTKNNFFIIYFIISFAIQFIILFIPVFQKYFNLAKLSFWDISIIIVISLIPILVVELFKKYFKD